YPTLSPDTDPEAERIQIEIFRRMPGLRPTLREWIGALTVPRAPSKSPWRLRLSPARPLPPLPSPPLPPGEGAPPPKTREKRGLGFPLSRSVGGRWERGQGEVQGRAVWGRRGWCRSYRRCSTDNRCCTPGVRRGSRPASNSPRL